MQWFRFGILVIVVSMVQASNLIDAISINNIKPDLFVIFLVFFSVYFNPFDALIASFCLGFFADVIVVGSAMGPGIISFVVAGTILANLNRRPKACGSQK